MLRREELQLAFRNKAMPAEGLHYDVTPTGLHYTLTHFDIPFINVVTWRLSIGGAVQNPLELSFEELQWFPEHTLRVTLECAGDGRALLEPRPLSQPWLSGAVGTADWTGTPLHVLLEQAALSDNAQAVVFTGHDHGFEGGIEQDYQRALTLEQAMHPDVLVAWAMNSRPLEPQHGNPVRLIVPSWYGMASVKWLRSIDITTAPHHGFQNDLAYRYANSRDQAGDPVTKMRVRSLMVPPGYPDYLTRTRVLHPGSVVIEGRAWSGTPPVTNVEVSVDGGQSWAGAAVGPVTSPHAWQGWHFSWTAAPGEYSLCCRATDAAGNIQPIDPVWTARGMGNNSVVPFRVVVE